MQSGITTDFETTQFSGLNTRIINANDSPCTVLDMTIQPGFGAPAHISFHEDKLFIVIQGTLRYLIGDTVKIAEAGARVQAAKGVVHGFTNIGDGEARHILVSTPRHHEEFFRALHAMTQSQQQHLLAEIAAKCDQQIVGPLP